MRANHPGAPCIGTRPAPQTGGVPSVAKPAHRPLRVKRTEPAVRADGGERRVRVVADRARPPAPGTAEQGDRHSWTPRRPASPVGLTVRRPMPRHRVLGRVIIGRSMPAIPRDLPLIPADDCA